MSKFKMQRHSNAFLLCIAMAFSLLQSACDDKNSADNKAGPVVCPGDMDGVVRPDHWTLESHCPEVDAAYEMLFEDLKVHRLDIAISAEDYDITMADLNSKLSGGAPGDSDDDLDDPIYVPATVNFDGLTWTEVGMRYKGNSSLKSAWQSGIRKLAFRLDFDRYEGTDVSLSNQRFYGFSKLTFSNGFKDPSLIRDKLAADIFRAGGVPAAHSAFARIYVDFGAGPTYFGLYTMIEDPSDEMLDYQFGDNSGNLYKPEGDGATWNEFIEDDFDKKTNETDSDWSDVIAAIDALHADQTDAESWRENLESVFDVEAFLRCLAINQVIENFDSYGFMPHNYYIYADPGNGGRITWFPWDLNLSLLHQMVEEIDPGEVMLDEISDDWPLIRFLLDDPFYREFYKGALAETIDEAFIIDDVFAKIDTYHALIQPFVTGDDGEESPYTFLKNAEEFEDSVQNGDDALKPHIESRHQAVADALAAENSE